MRRPRKKNEMMRKISILFIMFVLTFILGEMILRVIDRFVSIYDIEMAKYATSLKIDAKNPDIAHLHRKSSKAHLMGVDVFTNSLGLRDREYSFIKPDNVYRILVLGDSVTLGWGVKQEDCYTRQLEKMLNTDNSKKTGLRYEVINSGVGNYNTVQEVARFKEDLYKLMPDMIVVGFFVNDAEPVPTKTKSFFLNHSHLAVLIWSRLDNIVTRMSPKQNYRGYYKDLYNNSNPGWARCKNSFVELNRYCLKNKIKLSVVFIPELHDLTDRYAFKEILKKLEIFSKSQRIDYLDLYPYFKNQDARKLWVSYEDAHPNQIGHRMIAAGIYEYMIRKGLLR